MAMSTEIRNVTQAGESLYDASNLATSGIRNVNSSLSRQEQTLRTNVIQHGSLASAIQQLNNGARQATVIGAHYTATITRQRAAVQHATAAFRSQARAQQQMVRSQKSTMASAQMLANIQMATIAAVSIAIKKLTIDQVENAIKYETNLANMVRLTGESGKSLIEWGNQNALALGMSKREFASLGSSMSSFFKSFTNDSNQNIALTQEFTKVIAQFAASSGTSIEETAARIKSGLLGSSEAVDNLGIEMKVSAIEMSQAFKKLADGKSWAQLDANTQNAVKALYILEVAKNKLGSGMPQTTAFAMMQLSAIFDDTALAIGQALLPVLQISIPYIMKLGQSFAYAASYVQQFSAALFGIPFAKKAIDSAKEQHDGIKKLSSGYDNLGKSKDKAAKAGGQSSGFDELNVITPDSKDGATGGEGGAGTDSALGLTPELPELSELDLSNITKSVDKFKELMATMFGPLLKLDISPVTKALSPLIEIDWTPMVNGIASLTGGFTSLFNSVMDNVLGPFIENVITPLAEKLAEGIIPNALRLIGESFEFISKILEPLEPILTKVWEVLGWIAGLVFDAITESLKLLGDLMSWINDMAEKHPEAWNILINTIAGVAIVFGLLAAAIMIWAGAASIAAVATGIFTAVMAVLTSPITLIILGIVALIAIVMALVEYWPEISKAALECWNGIVSVFSDAWTWFDTNVVQPIVTILTTLWKDIVTIFTDIWKDIVTIFTTLWEDIVTIFTTLWKDTVKIFTDIWTSISDIFNSVYKSISDILSPIINWLDTNIIKPIVKLFEQLWTLISDIFTQSIAIVSAIVKTIVAFIDLFVIKPLNDLWETFKTNIEILWTAIVTMIQLVFGAIVDWIDNSVIKPIKKAWDLFKTAFGIFWDLVITLIQEKVKPIITWMDDKVIKPLTTAWEDFKTTMGKIWDGLVTGMKIIFAVMINGIITQFESFLNIFVRGINFIVSAMNKLSFKVPDWVPDIGGKEFGFKLNKIEEVKFGRVDVPKLATGGIVDRATLAMIGEGSSSEAVIPLNEAGLEPLINGITNAMSQIMMGNNNKGQQGDIVLNIDGKEFARAIYKHTESEKNRRSNSFVLVT